jgi:integrase
MRFRFTMQKLEVLTTEKEREWFFDDQVPQLACLVTKAGGKAFYLYKFFGGKTRRIRIAGVGELPLPKVRTLALDMLAELLSGKVTGSSQAARVKVHTLQSAFDEHLEFVTLHRKASTVKAYGWQWEKYVKSWAGNRALRDFKRPEMRAFHTKLGKEHGHHTANRVLALIRAVINRAILEHELEIHNPAAGIQFFREQDRTRRLHLEELPAFFEAVRAEPNTDIRDFVLLALFTGVRKSNLLAMRWEHLSMENGLWTIPAFESKTGVPLIVVLASFAITILTARRPTISGPFVFPGIRGAEHMMDPKMGWKRILERAGLQDLRMHDLRRSLASFQIDTGAPLEVIQKTLGHGNKATTEIYARMAMDPVRASVEKAIEAMVRVGRSV